MRHWLVVFLVIGCSSSTPTGPTRDHPMQPDGAHCNAAMECASGVCEGQGCGPGQGVCAAKQRICTEDMAEFCGCDGKVFRGSSSCPSQRYENTGACRAGDDHPVQGDGASCNSGKECASGVCEGEGCGEIKGVCKPQNRICTQDIVEYCGCDGKTFGSSGTCPRQRYASRGACPGK
jgi:hypothetical protein